MLDEEPLLVDCGEHGKRVATVVCRHLLEEKGRKVGFVENNSDPNDLQAWCDDCERLFLEEGEMTEQFRAFSSNSLTDPQQSPYEAGWSDIKWKEYSGSSAWSA